MTSLHGDTEGQVSLPCYLPFDIVFFELWHVAVLCALPVVDDASWRQLCWCTSQFDWDQSFEFSKRWPKSVQKSKEVHRSVKESKEVHRSVKESKEVLKSVDFQKYLGEALFYNPDSRFHIGRQQDLAHYVARPAFCRMGLVFGERNNVSFHLRVGRAWFRSLWRLYSRKVSIGFNILSLFFICSHEFPFFVFSYDTSLDTAIDDASDDTYTE